MINTDLQDHDDQAEENDELRQWELLATVLASPLADDRTYVLGITEKLDQSGSDENLHGARSNALDIIREWLSTEPIQGREDMIHCTLRDAVGAANRMIYNIRAKFGKDAANG